MNTISTDQLLSQIRTMGRELQPITMPEVSSPVPQAGFGDLLRDSLQTVNAAQKTASAMKIDFETGSSDKSLAEVMIASQKADLSFRALTEVRNKLVSAYQDIMNMPV